MKHPNGRCKVIGHTEEELNDISGLFRIKLAEVLDAQQSSGGLWGCRAYFGSQYCARLFWVAYVYAWEAFLKSLKSLQELWTWKIYSVGLRTNFSSYKETTNLKMYIIWNHVFNINAVFSQNNPANLSFVADLKQYFERETDVKDLCEIALYICIVLSFN